MEAKGLGFKSLLNIDANTKTIKGQKQGYMTAVMYLAPYNIASKEHNVCPYSTPGCRAGCLYSAGRGSMTTVQKARVNRTKYFIENRANFMLLLVDQISRFRKKANKKGLIPVVRLNGTSDIDWNFYYRGNDSFTHTIFNTFPDLQFYDYTKDTRKILRKQPDNYHLTYSYNENSAKDFCYDLLHNRNINVAVVFNKEGYKQAIESKAIDGEINDLRMYGDQGKIVALLAKGQAKKDKTGFVRGKVGML